MGGLLEAAVLLGIVAVATPAQAANLDVNEGTTYDFSEGAATYTSGLIAFYDENTLSAILNHSGGTIGISFGLYLGYYPGASGIYDLSGTGELTASSE